jgi:hypothetical protein
MGSGVWELVWVRVLEDQMLVTLCGSGCWG